MAALNLAGKTSGYIKLKSPDVALNATVELPNKDGILATLDDIGSGGGSGGETATLESLGIPNHDKVIVGEDGDAIINGLTVGKGSGVNCTVLGENALANSTTNNNVAVGYQTGANLTTGHSCTFVGLNAGNTVNANYLVAIGEHAMAEATGGGQSVAVGGQSLRNNNGSYNTAVGYHTLYTNTNGTYNTAIGNNSQSTNISGGYNTSLGGNALKDGDGYSYNTAVGYNALVNSSADANTALGFNAGSQITTGQNNTCIGNGTQPSSATANHEITLGNSSVTKLRCQVTTITGLSDSRDKKDIQAVPSAIDFIKKMKPVTFTWNMRDKSVIDKKAIGFIAQDLKQLQEESGLAEHLDMIIEREDGTLEASPMSTYPLLVKAVQELAEKTTIIDKLLAKVEALEEKLKKVK
jgi:hypothetical protein